MNFRLQIEQIRHVRDALPLRYQHSDWELIYSTHQAWRTGTAIAGETAESSVGTAGLSRRRSRDW